MPPRSTHRLAPPDAADPRESAGAEVIELATRRAMPQVTQRRGHSDGLTLLLGIALVGGLGAFTLWSLDGARQVRQAAPARPAPAAVRPLPVIAPLRPAAAPVVLPQAPIQPGAQAQAAPAANPLTTPAVVFDASSFAAPVVGPAGAGALSTGSANDDFAARLGVSGSGAAVASAGINPKTTVSQGTLIPAVLETAIDTDVPGYARAVVSTDVRSFDGSRVLIPRSSRLIGQYKSGMQAGQKRAYVIWTRLIRPDGASVALGSPAVSQGGEAGIAGKVDSHFFERFGSAMMLSLVGGLQAVASGGTTLVLGGGQSAAAAAVGQTGNIGPTVRIRQGEPIRVFTARDLDFSKVSPE